MFKILGADGREYGPVSAEVLRQWIAEGRANGETRALREGDTNWRLLAEFPEFAQAFAPGRAPAPLPVTYVHAPAPRNNRLAVAGLVLGILSVSFGLCCSGLPINVAGIVCSIIALVQINKAPQTQQGRGMAITGLVLSIIGLLLSIVVLLFVLLGDSDFRPRIHRL